VTSVSSAVLDSSGRPVMAISGTGFTAQLPRTKVKLLGESLRERAHLVSRALSGGGVTDNPRHTDVKT